MFDTNGLGGRPGTVDRWLHYNYTVTSLDRWLTSLDRFHSFTIVYIYAMQ